MLDMATATVHIHIMGIVDIAIIPILQTTVAIEVDIAIRMVHDGTIRMERGGTIRMVPIPGMAIRIPMESGIATRDPMAIRMGTKVINGVHHSDAMTTIVDLVPMAITVGITAVLWDVNGVKPAIKTTPTRIRLNFVLNFALNGDANGTMSVGSVTLNLPILKMR